MTIDDRAGSSFVCEQLRMISISIARMTSSNPFKVSTVEEVYRGRSLKLGGRRIGAETEYLVAVVIFLGLLKEGGICIAPDACGVTYEC